MNGFIDYYNFTEIIKIVKSFISALIVPKL
jgi:hypothetical protein